MRSCPRALRGSPLAVLLGFVVGLSGLSLRAAPTPAPAAPTSLDRSIAVLEQLLPSDAAALPVAPAPESDAARIYLGDQGYRPDTLRAWRAQLLAVRAALAAPAAPPEQAAAAPGSSAAPGAGGDDRVLESAFASVAAPQLWPGGVVPYVFDAAVTPAQRQAFLDAAGEISAFANVTFVPRVAQADYVRVQTYGFSGGRADVGRIGGQQRIEIGTWNRGTLVHEIGHCLGLVHEHQRADRDSYVTIHWENVVPGTEGNFILLPSAVAQGAYDFESVMHYARNLFSLDPASLRTLEPLPAYAAFGPILDEGPYDRALSGLDRTGLATVYGPPAITPGAIVKNTRDSGPGSLRAAIYHAWDHPGTTITFQIPLADPGFAGGVFTITPSDMMTRLGPSTTLDATTQTAFTGNTNPAGPEVVLAGTAAVMPYVDGLRLRSAGSTVRGLVVRDFGGTGIRLTGPGATGITIAGCYVGTTATGATAAPNAFGGITLEAGAALNTLGGTTTAARNVVSGNTAHGIALSGAGTTANVIAGNFVGLTATGTAALPNSFAGVALTDGAANNRIGGTAAGAGNVISGNTLQGLVLSGLGTTANRVEGNALGTDATRTFAVPNGWSGVALHARASANTIGGTTTAAMNLISGNTFQGVTLSDPDTSANVIAGNRIGTNAAGTAALANGWAGINLFSGASGNTIGGTSAGAGNLVSGNMAQGILLQDAGTSANVVAGNRVGTNAAGTGPVPNAWAGINLAGGAASNTIGGTTTGAGNLVSGNLIQGVLLQDAGTTGNLVAGNRIGTNAAGTAALANTYSGVELLSGASDNLIGGPTAAARNVISGNGGAGVIIAHGATTLNRVEGNFIGTSLTGTAALPNAWGGVQLSSGTVSNTIGGTAPGTGNVISGNTGSGLQLSGGGLNKIYGNLIGLAAGGTAPLGNLGSGIELYGATTANTIGGWSTGLTPGGRNWIAGNAHYGITLSGAGTTGNSIGGNTLGQRVDGVAAGNGWTGIGLWGGAAGNSIGSVVGLGNIITASGDDGITLWDAATSSNIILRNQIFANGGRGISLHSGANAGRSAPSLTSVTLGLTTQITGMVNVLAAGAHRLEFFASVTPDGSGAGEAEQFIGGLNLDLPAGNAPFAVNLATLVPPGRFVTATVLDFNGNSSEFAANRVVTIIDSDTDGLPDIYETTYTMNPASAADAAADRDGDGFTALQEFYAGTHPLQSTSAPAPLVLTFAGADVIVTLPNPVAGKIYQFETRDELGTPPWRMITTGLGQNTAAPLTWTDLGAATLPRKFYRAVVLP